MPKNKMRAAILRALKEEIVLTYDLAKKTKGLKDKETFVKEINHLYSQDLIIPVYQDGQQYFVCK